MKIYTKILIGMAVGAIIGLTVGPKSAMMDHDLFKLSDASKFEILLDRKNPDSRLKLPAVPLSFERDKLENGTIHDKAGRPHEVAIWAQGTFELTDKLLLKYLGDKLTHRKPGQQVKAWLKLKHTATENSVHISPSPVSGLGNTIIAVLKPVGSLFLRLIKMVIVPLVFASLLVGVASLGDIRKLGRLGGKTLGLYLTTTALAVTIGLVCAHVINPGSFVSTADKAQLVAQFSGAAGSKAHSAAQAPSTIDNILNIIPSNPLGALSSGNMLQIIFFALIFGVALTMMGTAKAQPVITFFDRVQEAMVVIIHMVMEVAPYGVAALIADVVGNSGASVLGALLIYGLAVVVGLLIHAGGVYGTIVRSVAKLKLGDFLRAIRPAQLIAFSTSSSSATLPVSLECSEENLGVSNSVSSFVLPLGSTVNMDGTALYQGVAAVFIAQVFSIDLTIGDQLTIVLTATIASIGAAGVPGAGMVTLAMVLTTVGIPQVGIALILGMDRILDMFRTSVNVTGDLAVTAAIAVSEGETLTPLTPEADMKDPSRGFEGRLESKV